MNNENEETAETTSIAMIKRRCIICDEVAIPLEGVGTDCENCHGEYGERAGHEIYEVPKETAENYRENFPEAVSGE